jgi:putative phosphotransacetylase
MDQIPISISARHLHLSRAHVEALFGPGHQLRRKADLSQPGQFACEETVAVVGSKGTLGRVRVLGPERKETQVEISRTDAVALGVDAPIRASGEVAGSPGIKLVGPAGEVVMERGVIVAQRHVHMSPADAASFGVRDKDWVMMRVDGERGLIFDAVLVRVSDQFRLDMHIDTDEANAAALRNGSQGTLIKAATSVQPTAAR